MKILVVETDAAQRDLIEQNLCAFGYAVTACADGESALAHFQAAPYSFVMLALGLPDLDGIALCRRLRALPQGSLCVILVLSERDAPADLHAALEAGANDFLLKPVSRTELHARLTIIERQFRNVLRRKQAERAQAEHAEQIAQAKQEWEATADSLTQVVCLLDREGRILRANRAIEQWQIGRVQDVKTQPLHHFLHPGCARASCYLPPFLSAAWEMLTRGQGSETEAFDPALRKEVRLQIRPISQYTRTFKADAASFAVCVLEDLTMYKHAQAQLSQQDRLLLGIAGAMNHLLITPDLDLALSRALKTLGLAANVDRVYLFENQPHPAGNVPTMSQRVAWDRFSADIQHRHPEFQRIRYDPDFRRWYDVLSVNQPVCGLVRDLPAAEREILAAQNILSLILVPIMLHDHFWGFLGFEDCHQERRWREEEEAVLFALAGSIGGALLREQTEQQLRQTSVELREVFQALPDEYFRLGADDRILDYNVGHGAELALPPDTFIGQWANGCLPAEVERRFTDALARVRATQQLVALEYRLPTAAGPERWAEVRLLPFLHDQLIVVARDITPLKNNRSAATSPSCADVRRTPELIQCNC